MTPPLVPPDCNLRKYQFIQIEIERLRRSRAWLIAKNNPEIGGQFKGLTPGSSAFDSKWKEVAGADPEKFKAIEAKELARTSYDPVRSKADGLGVPNTPAVNNVLWSTAVQHGQGGANKILSQAWKPGMSEKAFIDNVYDKRTSIFENSKHYNSTPAAMRIKDSVVNRFQQEKRDAYGMIGT